MLSENPMANNIVKWMKTKLNGYKQFTVMPNDLGTDGRLSDTEFLIRPSNFLSQESVPITEKQQHNNYHFNQNGQRTPVVPVHNNAHITFTEAKAVPSSSTKRHLNFEELECDVSVEGCALDKNGSGHRQEFSFTLYDLDGHGKITKDDIAGLVKTIYETLGQSIKVPHYGSKTIKVKLTVSPEKKKSNNEEVSANNNNEMPKKPHCKDKDGIGVVCNKWRKETNNNCRYHREKRHKQFHQQQNSVAADHRSRRRHSISSSGGIGGGLGEGFSEDREADVSENEQEEPILNNRRFQNPAFINNTSPIYSRYKKRSSSLQRQELLQIIQANMEKNNLCFHTIRKPSNNYTAVNENHELHRRNKLKNCSVTSAGLDGRSGVATHQSPLNNCNECSSGRGPVNFSNKCNKTFQCSFDNGGHAHGSPTSKAAGRPLCSTEPCRHAHKKNHHYRSRSYDLPNCRYSFSEDKHHTKATNGTPRQFPELAASPAEATGTHKTRDQVVRWLEQEFCSTPAAGKQSHHRHHSHRKESKCQQSSSPLTPQHQLLTSSMMAEDSGQKSKLYPCSLHHHQDRQEHHHIHEHVHHHYHHYRDSMPIVV